MFSYVLVGKKLRKTRTASAGRSTKYNRKLQSANF